MRRGVWIILLGVVVVGGAYLLLNQSPEDSSIAVIVPQLSALAVEGEAAFGENCAECHGQNASGGKRGPPLIHIIYEPSHHSDISFLLAARNGVRAHHWRYGNMPAQPNATESEIDAIVRYVRELQRANGIFD